MAKGAEQKGKADAAADEEATPKSRKGLWLTLAAVVLLAGGGGGYWWFAMQAKPAATAEATSANTKLPLQFYALDPPFVANFEGTQAFRFLQVSVRIATRSNETMLLLKANEPIVRNDLLLLFTQQDAEKLSFAAGKQQLRDEALTQVRNAVKTVGGKPETVESVLFTSLVMQ